MRTRTIFLIAFLLIALVSIILFAVSLLIQGNNSTLFLLGAVIAGAVALLAGFKDVVELVERFTGQRQSPQDQADTPPSQPVSGIVRLAQETKVESGVAVIGDDNVAQGAGAVNVAGDVTGNINTGTVIEKQVVQAPDHTADEATLRQAYLTNVLDEVSRLSLAGVDPRVAADAEARLDLSAVYTALLTIEQESLLTEERTHLITEAGTPLGRETSNVSALAQLDRHARLVLLGDPGSGKSTFVNFLVLCMAGELTGSKTFNLARLTAPLPDEKGRDQDQPQPWTHGTLLPVRVILRDFAAAGLPPVGRPATGQHLWRFIETSLSRSLPEYAPYLRRTLLEDGGLICLDGLDEVPAAGDRRVQIKQAVEQFAATFSRCRFLVTSRTYAYQQQAWRLTAFEDALLAPFAAGQIRRFITRWYTYIGTLRGWDEADTIGRAALLERAIFDSDRLRALAERPLLLTLMASLHAWRGGTLPEKREELYSDTVDLLLDWWERQRVRRDADGNIQVDQPSLAEWLKTDRGEVRRLLNRLAFDAHAGQTDLVGTADIPETALLNGLLQLSKNPDVKPRRLIEYLSQRAGLLIARGVGVYTFPHRTFQEYLAACHLTDDDFPDKVADLARTDPNRWREVTLLAGAKATRGMAPAIWLLAEALCDGDLPAAEAALPDLWGGQLAGEALVETADLRRLNDRNARKLARVKRWLLHIMRGNQLPATERALAARSLALLGDPRLEVLTLDGMQLCYVPAGPFWMGSRDDDEAAQDREKPLHKSDLPYDYWVGRYPITNDQFGAFIEAGGYNNAAYWPEAHAAGEWREDGMVDEGRWRRSPYNFGAPFNLPNRPVVGIMWYEALAFTRWLTDQWRATGQIPANWRVQLPSEAEWEKVARGGLQVLQEPIIATVADLSSPVQPEWIKNAIPQRIYPWGDQLDVERANMRDADIGSTSGVGCFADGVTVYGCEEMSGNVFEWTRTIEKPYPYKTGDGREDLQSRGIRILRGGYYGDDGQWSRCAYRDGDFPNFGLTNGGFRIVVSPFFAPLGSDVSDL